MIDAQHLKIKLLESENMTMKDALEFYENCNRLMISVRDIPTEYSPWVDSMDIMDNGDRARSALVRINGLSHD